MNFRNFSCLVLFSLTAFACKGDDDDATGGDIEGTWKLEASRGEVRTKLGDQDISNVTTYVSGDVVITFRSDGTFEQAGTGTYRQDITVNGETSTQTSSINSAQTGNYTVSGNTLSGFGVSAPAGSPTPVAAAELKFSVRGDMLTFDGPNLSQTIPDPNGGTASVTLTGSSEYERQ